jgi:hypothetical protein
MTSWLLMAAAIFAYLAVDARRMTLPDDNTRHEFDAIETAESTAGLSVEAQQNRTRWLRRCGLGRPSQVVWLWISLAIGCLVGAILRAMA